MNKSLKSITQELSASSVAVLYCTAQGVTLKNCSGNVAWNSFVLEF